MPRAFPVRENPPWFSEEHLIQQQLTDREINMYTAASLAEPTKNRALLNVKQAAERLQVSPGLIYALVEANQIGHHRVGRGRGRIRFSEENLADYLRGTESRPADPVPHRQPVKLKHLRG